MGKATASFRQQGFRGRADDVALNSATFTHALNTNWTQATDTNFRVRFLVEETAGAGENVTWAVYYSHNGGTYAEVTTTTPVKVGTSTHFADDDVTTAVLTGTGTFLAGYGSDVDARMPNAGNQAWSGSQYTNLEQCLTIDSAQVADNDTIALRIYKSTGVALTTYTQMPTITVSETVQSITGSGALTAGSAAISGAGASSSAGTGALAASASTADGTGASVSTGAGTPQAGSSSVSGSGASSTAGTGVLAASGAAIASAGASSSVGSGTLVASGATVDGADSAGVTGSGTLDAGNVAVAGSGASGSGGPGALAAQTASVDGAGTSASHGSGIIGSAVAMADGLGGSSSTGTGALSARSVTVAGGEAAEADEAPAVGITDVIYSPIFSPIRKPTVPSPFFKKTRGRKE